MYCNCNRQIYWYHPAPANWNAYYHYGYHQQSPYPQWNQARSDQHHGQMERLQDFGPNPFVTNIEKAAEHNSNFRMALWTGNHLQVTLMSIKPGESIGLEIHPDTDQFLRIEDGHGFVEMGANKDRLNFQRNVEEDDAIFVPAGTWHNVTNTGRKPLKLYTIYAPSHHPHGTVHATKEVAMAEEGH